MPRKIPELPDIQIRRLRHSTTKNGKPCKRQYAVGGVTGLLLQCMPPVGNERTGSRQWILRATIGDKRKELGLGGYPSIPAKDAREAARKLLADISSGKDPITEKRSQVAKLRAEQAKEITFEQWTREAFIPAEAAGYKGAAQIRRLNQLLRDYVFPHLGDMYFEDITKQDIRNVLDPIMGFKLPQD